MQLQPHHLCVCLAILTLHVARYEMLPLTFVNWYGVSLDDRILTHDMTVCIHFHLALRFRYCIVYRYVYM